MKNLKRIGLAVLMAISISGLTGCNTSSHVSAGIGAQYVNPSWAPPYYGGVRYYYLPDIEVYYDLANQDFVYLNNGQWMFSPFLPPMYGYYDLYDGFVIALDITVFQPWLHHHYYVSHYPRYYYHNVYKDRGIATIKGFNENQNKPFLWKQEDRDRIKDFRKNRTPDRQVETPRQPQAPNYYGKNIGRPVRVKPQMRDNRSGKGG